MCTVTWLTTPGGHELFCNRDERHERAEAAPPAVHERAGVRFVAPNDPDGGGTWIAVNEHGVSLCLVNGYAADDDLHPSEAFTSRGRLVLDLADAASGDDVLARLADRPLDAFRSFRLLVLDRDAAPRAAAWNRAAATLSEETPDLPLISCPVRTDDVHATRREALKRLVAERGGLDARVLAEFHRSRHAEEWIWSVSMHHEVAATRSHSHVRVTPEAVTFTYTPGRPCTTPPDPPVVLTRGTPGS